MPKRRGTVHVTKRGRHGISIAVFGSLLISTACKPRKESDLKSTDAEVYSFGGACGSRGFWTQTALSRTKEVSSTLSSIKNNPKCLALHQKFMVLQNETQNQTTDAYRFGRLMTLPREITTLNSYIKMTDYLKNEAVGLLFDRTLEHRVLMAKSMSDDAAPGGISIKDQTLDIKRGQSLFSVEGRLQQGGIQYSQKLQAYYEALSESHECISEAGLMQSGGVISQNAQLLGAFASADPATASLAGNSIGSFYKMIRDMKYTNSINQANDAMFTESIGCMLESAQYSYCGARDAMDILKSGGARLGSYLEGNGGVKNSVFYGYYLMTYHLPVIQRWLGSILTNYVPVRKDHAKMLNALLEIPIDVEIYAAELRAIYEQYARQVLETRDEDPTVRASHLLHLVQILADRTFYSYFPRPLDKKKSRGPYKYPNFFILNLPTTERIKFYYIGLTGDLLPKEVLPPTEGNLGKQMHFRTWVLSSQNGYQSVFLDSDKLLKTIHTQLENLISEGAKNADEYFWRNLPIDFTATAATANAGTTATPMQSMRVIQSYILDLIVKARARQSIADRSYIDVMTDLYTRLEAIRVAHEAYLKTTGSDKDAQEFVKTVYLQLNMLMKGHAFIGDRLISFVQKDIAERIRENNLGAKLLEPEIMLAAGDLAFERIADSLGVEGSSSQAGLIQLSKAQALNLEALSAIETAFSEKLKAVLSKWSSLAQGAEDTASLVFSDSVVRSELDSHVLPRAKGVSFSDRFYNAALDTAELVDVRSFLRRSLHPDLYPMPNPWLGRRGFVDDEFHSRRKNWARLCILTLALPKSEQYAPYCKGAFLTSEYETYAAAHRKQNDIGSRPLSIDYDNWRNSFPRVRGSNTITASPVCAAYDMDRRNQIYFATLDHIRLSDKGEVPPLPSTNLSDNRQFATAVFNPTQMKPDKLREYAIKHGQSDHPSTTYCATDGSAAPAICSDFEKVMIQRGYPTHGSVAVSCYDRKGQLQYCCNGSAAAGALPPSVDAPCFGSINDKKTMLAPLTDQDLN